MDEEGPQDYLWTASGAISCLRCAEELEKPSEGRKVSEEQCRILQDARNRLTFLNWITDPRTGSNYPPDVTAWDAFLTKKYIKLGKEDPWVKKDREASAEASGARRPRPSSSAVVAVLISFLEPRSSSLRR